MKTEVSLKRRFLRKKIKYMLMCVFVVAVIFVLHQLFYFKELNRATVGKLIAGSMQDGHRVIAGKQANKWNQPYHLKLIRDKNNRTVSLRGTRDQDIAKYLPNINGKFVCFVSKKEIEFVKVNDNYCDCPIDGSDEPGTNACNNGFFNCKRSSKKLAGNRISLQFNKNNLSKTYINLQQEYHHTKSMMDIAIVVMVLMNGLKLQCYINSAVSLYN